jgi:hypothetical protein
VVHSDRPKHAYLIPMSDSRIRPRRGFAAGVDGVWGRNLFFTLTRATQILKENVFPDFYESEQGPDYDDGLREEPRDLEPP